jgi:nicotinamidase-related amidase
MPKALIIIDMLKDFVDPGAPLENPRASAIVAPITRLLEHARTAGWVVVYSNDAHRSDDPELAVWGEHAMAGTDGAQVIDALAPNGGSLELISLKRVYGAFDFTDLDDQLKALEVDEVVITGQHASICCRHTSYGALIRGYKITVPADAVCDFEGVEEAESLAYLETIYKARVTTVDDLVNEKTEQLAPR